MASSGEITARIGEQLANTLKPRGYEVFYDHGKDKDEVGNLVSWLGTDLKRDNELSHVDIAVREGSSSHVLAIIEIEETNDRPKTILGDLFAVLLADHVTFKGETVQTGEWTTLLVLAKGPASHGLRNQLIVEAAMRFQQSLSMDKQRIGKIMVESIAGGVFEPEATTRIEQVVSRSGSAQV